MNAQNRPKKLKIVLEIANAMNVTDSANKKYFLFKKLNNDLSILWAATNVPTKKW